MRNYNSKYEIVNNKRICYYCGKELNHYEDRMGCDYREDGEHYWFCDCDAAHLEQEYNLKIQKINSEFNNKNRDIEKNRQIALSNLDNEYSEILKRNPELDNIKYKYELNEIKKKYNK